MKFRTKRIGDLLLWIGIFLLPSALVADTSNNYSTQATDLLDTVNQKDLWAIRNWLKSKRVALNAKGGDLSIAGDVKAEWRNVTEKLASINLTGGPQSPGGWSNNLYLVDFRLYFDYKADKTWASVKLEFNDAAGMFGGQANQLALNRANMGYHFYDDGTMKLEALVGRQRGYDLYDSELQFNATLDGFTGAYSVSLESLAECSLRGGGYIVDAVYDQAVWIIQAGLYDILDTGLYAEYAFTDWHKQNRGNTIITNSSSGAVVTVGPQKWDFMINQFILGYTFDPDLFRRDVRLFGGILWNADASPLVVEQLSLGRIKGDRQNMAGWVALQVGSVEKAGDWAFQAQWQVAQALSVPDYDVAGIGTGNSTNSALFGFNSFSKAVNFPKNGNANFNGWELDLLYSVSNELVLEARLQRALSANNNIGFPLNYTNFVLEAVYGF